MKILFRNSMSNAPTKNVAAKTKIYRALRLRLKIKEKFANVTKTYVFVTLAKTASRLRLEN